jgi:hypothetical protein
VSKDQDCSRLLKIGAQKGEGKMAVHTSRKKQI